jgi:hypothetical protein
MNRTRPRIAALLSAAVPAVTIAALAAAPLASGAPAAVARASHVAFPLPNDCSTTGGVTPSKWPWCGGD